MIYPSFYHHIRPSDATIIMEEDLILSKTKHDPRQDNSVELQTLTV